MCLSVCRPVQSTFAASPSPASSWLLRPVRRTRWTQTAQYTETTYTAKLMDLYSSVRMYWGSDMCRSLLQDSSVNCVCVFVCFAVCALSEGAGCLQQLWLFSIRDPEDGEDRPGQTELGSAHRHSTGLPAHRTFVTPSLCPTFMGLFWNIHWTFHHVCRH